MAMEKLLCAFFCIFILLAPAHAAAEGEDAGEKVPEGSRSSFIDRIAVRTNALDWMLTIPNLGFEFDLKNSEFNDMTVGLSAKYNWNTWHYNRNNGSAYAPPVAYNLLDVRPEVRYWYRTRKGVLKKDDLSVENLLKNRKHPKTWRANYVGLYVNYATYTFKFGKKGMQGMAYGLGASTGYSLPMYEYRNGAVDVELGFSVGLQLCTRDMFVHNPDGYFYTQVLEGSKDMHMTPFPVVSDLRVAFVWRHKSIKDKVKEDTERNRVVRAFNTIQGDYNYNDFTKAMYDEGLVNVHGNRKASEIMANDTLYRKGYMEQLDQQEATLRSYIQNAFSDDLKSDPRVYEIVKGYEEKLDELITKRKKDAVRQFEKEWAAARSGAAKAEAKAAKEAEKAAEENGEPKEKVKKPEKEKRQKKDRDKGETEEETTEETE